MVVFEEATIFFGSKGRNEKMIELLVRSRHSQNTIILVFHSLRALPDYIYELINFIVLFKTQDHEQRVGRNSQTRKLV